MVFKKTWCFIIKALGWCAGACSKEAPFSEGLWEHHRKQGHRVLKAHHNISCRDNTSGKGLESTFQHGMPVLKNRKKVGKEKERGNKAERKNLHFCLFLEIEGQLPPSLSQFTTSSYNQQRRCQLCQHPCQVQGINMALPEWGEKPQTQTDPNPCNPGKTFLAETLPFEALSSVPAFS